MPASERVLSTYTKFLDNATPFDTPQIPAGATLFSVQGWQNAATGALTLQSLVAQHDASHAVLDVSTAAAQHGAVGRRRIMPGCDHLNITNLESGASTYTIYYFAY